MEESSVAQACVEVPHLVFVVVHPYESGNILVEERVHQWVLGVVDEREAQLWGREPHFNFICLYYLKQWV